MAEAVKPVKKRKRRKTNPVKKTFAVIGTTLLSLFLILVITLCIVATALTVYVMQFMESSAIDIDIYGLDLDCTTFIYAYDSDGNEVEIEAISRNANRIPVTLDEVPQVIQDAVVYTEDERFYDHLGVDWKRTFAAVVNEMLDQILGKRFGGSTITQQLVKNITADTEQKWDRKMREIFRAMQLEQQYTKKEILEAYLNYVGYGGNTCGIQAASHKYFNKDISELSLAEAAALAGIPQSPETINPFASVELNKERQLEVLNQMLKNAAISQSEYEQAVKEELHFYDPSTDKNPYKTTQDNITSWYTDLVIRDVILDMQELYGITFEEASDRLYNGGYKVYSCVDLEMQKTLENRFKSYENFESEVLDNPPQAAMIAMDYQGNILAVVGARGEKSTTGAFDLATRARRSPGSCVKPITSYSMAVENNVIHWSSRFVDKPLEIDSNKDGIIETWPHNYNTLTWTYRNYFTFEALARSVNTVPAQIVDYLTPTAVYTWLQDRFHITTLVASDANYAPVTVGSFSQGLTLRELTNAYMPFGNLGKYYESTSYYKVVDRDAKTVLQHEYLGTNSISEDSAYVMNRLMSRVVEDQQVGTGRAAKLENVPLIGKTGTAENYTDILFVGCTPEYVCGLWYGYEMPVEIDNSKCYGSAKMWKNLFGDIADAGKITEFPTTDTVIEEFYCTETGLIANGTCPVATKGYYKKNAMPPSCTINHHTGTRMDSSSAETTVPTPTPAPTQPNVQQAVEQAVSQQQQQQPTPADNAFDQFLQDYLNNQ